MCLFDVDTSFNLKKKSIYILVLDVSSFIAFSRSQFPKNYRSWPCQLSIGNLVSYLNKFFLDPFVFRMDVYKFLLDLYHFELVRLEMRRFGLHGFFKKTTLNFYLFPLIKRLVKIWENSSPYLYYHVYHFNNFISFSAYTFVLLKPNQKIITIRLSLNLAKNCR